MKRILAGLVALSVLAGTTAGALAAPHYQYTSQYRGDRGYDRGHNRYDYGNRDYRRGGYIDRSDWDRGRRIDYRAYNLERPARGYEWRYVNGHYVEAAIVGGLIATAIIAAGH